MHKLFTKKDVQEMINKGMTLHQIQDEIGFEDIGQGYGYKSEEAFLIGSSVGYEDTYICYIPEACYHDLDDGTKQIDLDSCYTRQDFLGLTNHKDNARALFDSVDWQHPSSLWEEWDTDIMPWLSTEREFDDENTFRGDYFQVTKLLKADYMNDDVELSAFFATCKAPDLTIEDVVRLYSDLKLEIDGDQVFEFKDGTKEIKALWSLDEPFYSKKEVADLFSSYVDSTDPLMAFIEQEIPFRMQSILGVDTLSPEIISQLIDSVKENTHIMFDYDGFDSFLEHEYEKLLGLDSKEISAIRGELSNLHHELNGAIEFEPELVPKIEKRIMELEDALDAALKLPRQDRSAAVPEFTQENFIDDKAKMRDFVKLSKEEFLQSYSYLTEEEYENTRALMQKKSFVMIAIFDDEVLVNDDLESLNGYLWSVDSLVDRLPSSENMENIKFFADYNLHTGEVKLTATYDSPSKDGEWHKSVDVPLSEEDKLELIYAFEQYCQDGQFGKPCLDVINDARADAGLAPIAPVEKKPSLSTLIESAEARSPGTDKPNSFKDIDR